MDESLDAVSRHCSDQLMNYQRCLLLHNNDSASPACNEPKRALSECAASAAPALVRLRELCAPKIKAYDACLAAHGHLSDEAFTEKCGPRLLDLYRCTQAVKAEMEHGGEAERQRGGNAFLKNHAPQQTSQ
ncbi:hypothetical protein OC835_005958 [Tilletia horrida]|uniref:IMS import disulfide relay-system CHCH-CHCH-like Cx9C domain-containing protein n=1 Tax=Tilletia horrida TaxID=155126 RepID=A0AAN6G6A4_9BASI|nr:hypothetical protein OC842_006242 [Tilletia horrida]KAK0524316.1 hypothetical protein OC835_005958 [Tilletia horrida]